MLIQYLATVIRDDVRVAVGGSRVGLGGDRSYRNVSVYRALRVREMMYACGGY
jgi:hypothetical protein